MDDRNEEETETPTRDLAREILDRKSTLKASPYGLPDRCKMWDRKGATGRPSYNERPRVGDTVNLLFEACSRGANTFPGSPTPAPRGLPGNGKVWTPLQEQELGFKPMTPPGADPKKTPQPFFKPAPDDKAVQVVRVRLGGDALRPYAEEHVARMRVGDSVYILHETGSSAVAYASTLGSLPTNSYAVVRITRL